MWHVICTRPSIQFRQQRGFHCQNSAAASCSKQLIDGNATWSPSAKRIFLHHKKMLNILSAICLWLAITTGGAIYLLPVDASNPIVLSLLFFNNLNILIAFCEIILGVYINEIQQDYLKFKDKYKGREGDGAIAFLMLPLPSPFHARSWSRMWSTYSLYDPSYQNHESFGFFIDVGNGLTTIPPCLLWNYAMAFPARVPSVWVGCIGIASYWQIMYGTILYFASFFFNKRYEGKSWGEVAAFVGISNSIWFIFPIMGLYASFVILHDGNLSLFQP